VFSSRAAIFWGGVYNDFEGGITVKNRIKISDFVKLTGSTLKTIIYYHKIGLLPEPEEVRNIFF